MVKPLDILIDNALLMALRVTKKYFLECEGEDCFNTKANSVSSNKYIYNANEHLFVDASFNYIVIWTHGQENGSILFTMHLPTHLCMFGNCSGDICTISMSLV